MRDRDNLRLHGRLPRRGAGCLRRAIQEQRCGALCIAPAGRARQQRHELEWASVDRARRRCWGDDERGRVVRRDRPRRHMPDTHPASTGWRDLCAVPLSGEDLNGTTEQHRHRDRHLHAGIRPGRQCEGCEERARDQRLPLDHRGRQDRLDRSQVPDQHLRDADRFERAPLPVETVGYNFHTANMPVVASGCLGTVSCEAGQTLLTAATACDVGNGVCRPAAQKDPLHPGQVYLDPAKRYFISVLPGDGVNTTIGGSTGPVQVDPTCVPTPTTSCKLRQFDITQDCGAYDPADPRWDPNSSGAMCGHAMGGAQIAVAPGSGTRPPVNISLQQTPLPTSKIAVFVFQDDNPLNGQEDSGGGVDVIAPNEAGLGGFEIKLFDQAGGLGDATGQLTYDMFNMPVSNSLAGTIDPITLLDACPIARNGEGGIVGMIPTCPKFEGDGVTLSPLAGQAVIANLYPGLYEVVAAPAADRIARGEEWLQTNTLDGGKAHEAFIKPNEPGYFQEFGPGGFHIVIGFANPKIINDRKAALCASQSCNATLNVQVTSTRMSRTPDQRLYSSGNYDAYGFTQCYLSIGPPDGPDFAFEKCRPDGTVTFTGMPVGNFRLTIFDQWNDLLLDGLVHPLNIDGSATVKEFPVTQWRTNLYTRTFIDTNGDGVSQDSERS